MPLTEYKLSKRGFSLIEVVLALGVFFISVLALIGLLAPMLQSVDEVEKIDEITSVVNTVNAFLQSSTKIAPGASKFDAIYSSVKDGNFATLFVFRQYRDATSTEVVLRVGFDVAESDVDALARITDFSNAAGPIYRVVLTTSSVVPEEGQSLSAPGTTIKYRSATRDEDKKVYLLEAPLSDYSEGYFAMEARIFAEDPPAPGVTFDKDKTLDELAVIEPDFTFNTAIIR